MINTALLTDFGRIFVGAVAIWLTVLIFCIVRDKIVLPILRKVWFFKDPDRCNICGKKLTAEEQHYYICNCEKCEGKLCKGIEEE